jgi:hypothetical protein
VVDATDSFGVKIYGCFGFLIRIASWRPQSTGERVGSPPGAWESGPAGHVLKVLPVIRPYLVLFPKASVPYSSRGHCSSRTYNLSGGVLFPTNWSLLSITSQRHHIRNP